jgi:hypothetical protein
MIHIDQMLADYATVHEGKLFLTGAGINVLTATPSPDKGYMISFGIGLLIKVSQDMANLDHRLLVSLADSDGTLIPLLENPVGYDNKPEDKGKIIGVFKMRPDPSAKGKIEMIMPLGFQFSALRIPYEGAYMLRAEVDGIELSYTQFQAFRKQSEGPPRISMADA